MLFGAPLIWIKTPRTGASKIALSSEGTGVLKGQAALTEPNTAFLPSAPVLAASYLPGQRAKER
jgi:hypothetical protein